MKSFYDREPSLSKEQEDAIERARSGVNVFLTGKANTGKTFVIKELAKRYDKRVVLLSATGRAALNNGWESIGDFLGLTPMALQADRVSDGALSQDTLKLIRAMDVLVIDDISMVSAKTFQELDIKLRVAVGGEAGNKAFGGKQIIVSGDFFQLGPYGLPSRVNDVFVKTLDGGYAFESTSWREAKFDNIVFERCYSSMDKEEADALDAIRLGMLASDSDHLAALNALCHRPPDPNAIALCSSFALVDGINITGLRSEHGRFVTFYGSHTGYFPEDAYPTSVQTPMKAYARAMIVADGENGEYRFGDIGVIRMAASSVSSHVQLLPDGQRVSVHPHRWVYYRHRLCDYGDGRVSIIRNPVGFFQQIPIRPAYAMLIEDAHYGVPLKAAWLPLSPYERLAPGELYTAMSSVISLKRVTIDRPLRSEDCVAAPEVVAFWNETLVNKA